MDLSLDGLKQSNSFSGAPVKKPIKWMQGEKEIKANVYVRPLSYQSAVSDLLSLSGKTDGVAGRIATSICDAKGQPIFTVADITGEADPARGALDGNLTMALLGVIGEVNGLGKQKS